MTLVIISSSAYAREEAIVAEGDSGTCFSKDQAIKLAEIAADLNAKDQCYSQDGWRYGRMQFRGYINCKPCGNSGEYKCYVTQASHTCKTSK